MEKEFISEDQFEELLNEILKDEGKFLKEVNSNIKKIKILSFL